MWHDWLNVMNTPMNLLEPALFLWLAGGVFGCCLGSFLNVCIWRIPLGESVVFVPSHCPKCHHPIRWFDNIPIIAWLALRGRCRDCKSPISPRYILVEAGTGALFLLLLWNCSRAGETLSGMVFYTIVLAVAIPCAFIDVEHRRLPDRLTFFGIIAGILYQWSFPAGKMTHPEGLLAGIIGAAAGILGLLCFAWLTKLLFRRQTLGQGDVKYAGFLGAVFGTFGMLITVCWGSILAVLSYGIYAALRKKRGDGTVPFGLFLGIAAILWCLVRPWLPVLVAMWQQDFIGTIAG